MDKSFFINQLGSVDIANSCTTINPNFLVENNPVTGEVCVKIIDFGIASVCAGLIPEFLISGDEACTTVTSVSFNPTIIQQGNTLDLNVGSSIPVFVSWFRTDPRFFECLPLPVDFSQLSYPQATATGPPQMAYPRPSPGLCGSVVAEVELTNGCRANIYFYFDRNANVTQTYVEYINCFDNLYFEVKCPNGDKINYEIIFDPVDATGQTFTVNWNREINGSSNTGFAELRNGFISAGELPSMECCEDVEGGEIGVILARNDIDIRFCSDKALIAQEYKSEAILKVETAKNSNVFEELVRQKLKPDDTGCDTWNIKDLVKSCLKCEFPDFASKEIFEHKNSARRFKVCFEETYIVDGEEVTELCEVGTFTAINAGINTKHLGFNTFRENYLNKPLTWQPQKQSLTTHQQNWLTIFNTQGFYDITLAFSLKDENGFSIQGGGIGEFTMQPNCMYSFPASICNLGIDLSLVEEGQTLCIQLLDQDGNVACEIEYCIICHEHYFNYFLLCNSIGGIDSIHFKGRKTKTSVFEGDFLNANKRIKKNNRRYTCKVLQETGDIFPNCQMWFLNEFFNAQEIKQINFAVQNVLQEDCECSCTDCQKGWYCDIEIPPVEISTTVDFEYDPLREFTYYEVEKKEVFTPALCAPDEIIDPCENAVIGLDFEVKNLPDGTIAVTTTEQGNTGTIQNSTNGGATYQAGNVVSLAPLQSDVDFREVRFVLTTECGNAGYILRVTDSQNYKVYTLGFLLLYCVPDGNNTPN